LPAELSVNAVWSLAAAAVIALAGCGGGSDPVTTTTTTPPPESDPPFSLRLPPEWRDVTGLSSRESGLAPDEEMVLLGRYTGPAAGGSTPSVLVSRPALARVLALGAFAERNLARLRSRPHVTVSGVRSTELDGAPAVTFSTQVGDRDRQRQVLVKNGSDGLQIVFTASVREFQRYRSDFQRILRSWRWKTG
jgi:hypothetical protein